MSELSNLVANLRFMANCDSGSTGASKESCVTWRAAELIEKQQSEIKWLKEQHETLKKVYREDGPSFDELIGR